MQTISTLTATRDAHAPENLAYVYTCVSLILFQDYFFNLCRFLTRKLFYQRESHQTVYIVLKSEVKIVCCEETSQSLP